MSILEIECPVCGEVLELSAEDRAELEVGDAIVCDNCNAEMEVTANAGETFDLELLGILTTCPNCGEEFDVTEEMLAQTPPNETNTAGTGAAETSTVQCPHCQAQIELDFEDAAGA